MNEFENLQKYAAELENHIRQVSNTHKHLEEILKYVRNLSDRQNLVFAQELKALREDVDTLSNHLLLKGMPGINRYEIGLQKIKSLLNSDEWPEAVPSNMLPRTEEDKQVRAETVLDILVTEFLDGLRFLDVGCGEGHMVAAAAHRGAQIAVGYDAVKQWKFNNTSTAIWTTELKQLGKYAPYDVILAYDVLDHIQEEDPVKLLHELKHILAPKGRFYLRCHPWVSRHGGHLYTKLNKAYAHMIFDEVEFLRLFGFTPDPTLRLENPVETYREWFRRSGFIIKSETISRKEIEPLFQSLPPALKERVDKMTAKPSDVEYVDYVLEKENDEAIL